VTYFLSEEYGNGGCGCFDVNAVAFEFFDAFGYEFVVVDERP
jgi:hypothetical protein